MNLKYINKLLNYLDKNYINNLKAIDEYGYIKENRKGINFVNINYFEVKPISFLKQLKIPNILSFKLINH